MLLLHIISQCQPLKYQWLNSHHSKNQSSHTDHKCFPYTNWVTKIQSGCELDYKPSLQCVCMPERPTRAFKSLQSMSEDSGNTQITQHALKDPDNHIYGLCMCESFQGRKRVCRLRDLTWQALWNTFCKHFPLLLFLPSLQYFLGSASHEVLFFQTGTWQHQWLMTPVQKKKLITEESFFFFFFLSKIMCPCQTRTNHFHCSSPTSGFGMVEYHHIIHSNWCIVCCDVLHCYWSICQKAVELKQPGQFSFSCVHGHNL